MKQVRLGRGGRQVSRLAYGCAALAGPWESGELTADRRRQALMINAVVISSRP